MNFFVTNTRNVYGTRTALPSRARGGGKHRSLAASRRLSKPQQPRAPEERVPQRGKVKAESIKLQASTGP